jgi:hypothetical protein
VTASARPSTAARVRRYDDGLAQQPAHHDDLVGGIQSGQLAGGIG